MIPKILHYCWFGKNPKSELAQKCIATWLKYNTDYQIIEWNEENFDVNHFFTFRRSEYEKTEKIDPSLSSAVDQDLYLKMYEMGEFQFLDLPLYKYRLHEKGVSQDKSKKQKLYSNWNKVLINALGRRKIEVIYGRKVSEIDNLAMFIFQKENTYIKKIQRKISCLFKSS